MRQVVKQIPRQTSEGVYPAHLNIAEQINKLLQENPDLQLTNVISVPVQKIGGTDFEYLVILSESCTSPCIDNSCPVHGITAMRDRRRA